MTRIMRKFLLVLCLFMVSSCKLPTSVSTIHYADNMEKSYDMMFSAQQFDSICVADSLDANLKNWHSIPFKNPETGDLEYEYSYIKSIDSIQVIYRLEPSTISDSVRITKRITY